MVADSGEKRHMHCAAQFHIESVLFGAFAVGSLWLSLPLFMLLPPAVATKKKQNKTKYNKNKKHIILTVIQSNTAEQYSSNLL